MKKIPLFLLLISVCTISNLFSQESYPSGTPIGIIFADFKYSLDKDIYYQGFNVNDGSLVVTGIQYKFRRQIKASLNYQAWSPASTTSPSWSYIQANMEFRF